MCRQVMAEFAEPNLVVTLINPKGKRIQIPFAELLPHSFNKNDLLKFRNFGKKSLTELEDLVKNKGLEFGMNVSKYKLDKE